MSEEYRHVVSIEADNSKLEKGVSEAVRIIDKLPEKIELSTDYDVARRQFASIKRYIAKTSQALSLPLEAIKDLSKSSLWQGPSFEFMEEYYKLESALRDSTTWSSYISEASGQVKDLSNSTYAFGKEVNYVKDSWADVANEITNAVYKLEPDSLSLSDYLGAPEFYKEILDAQEEILRLQGYIDSVKEAWGDTMMSDMWDESIATAEQEIKRVKAIIAKKVSSALKEGVSKADFDKLLGNTTQAPKAYSGVKDDPYSKKYKLIDWNRDIKQIVSGLVGLRTLFALVRRIASNNENLTNSVTNLISTISEILKPVFDWLAKLLNTIAKGLRSVFGVTKDTSKSTTSIAKSLAGFDEITNLNRSTSSKTNNETFGFVSGNPNPDFATGPVRDINNTGEALPAEVIDAMSFTNGIMLSVDDLIDKWNKIFDTIDAAREGIKSAIEWVGDSWSSYVTSPIKNKLKELKDSAVSYFDTIKAKYDALITGIKNIINKVLIGPINSAIATINKLPGVNISKIPTLANGGLVDYGQMFIAREAGPELVGTIGSKTAVANNDQIIAGIQQGVYNAMVSAMGSSDNSINLYLDGKLITKSVVNNINQMNRVRGVAVI